ncbi:hypothetical protein [Ktedonobacter racemifer]|uniref:Uncharacterized protein n=1 Tax=Ktedonobacter racemifer DSM 44963 TaxID=485913 RepID=D6U0U6_KTERA|nr:hypothetical protein [Ktedonobacter racemifer]EFH82436.1 hypothetical protein Krac_3248 [Ktedonobacter racemifer DSM 44963]
MLNEEEQAKEGQIAELLQQKPQRQTGWRLMPVLLLLGVTVILGGGLVAVWRVYTTNSASPTQTAKKGGPSTTSTSSGSAPWDNYPAVYWQTLRAQFAQGMHMTEQQIQDNFRSTVLATQTPASHGGAEISSPQATEWLNDLAQTQGISQDQLHTIEATAVQQAHAALVQQHVLTHQQADQTIHGMNQDDMNLNIIEAFLRSSQGKKS